MIFNDPPPVEWLMHHSVNEWYEMMIDTNLMTLSSVWSPGTRYREQYPGVSITEIGRGFAYPSDDDGF